MAKEKYIPTFEEVWDTGWTSNTGSFKKGIFQTKNNEGDLKKLIAVKEALEQGKVKLNVESLDKFNKTRAKELWEEVRIVTRQEHLDEMVAARPSNYITIDTELLMNNFLLKVEDEDLLGVDTETTGLDYTIDKIVGISFSLDKADLHYYIPFGHDEGRQLPREYVLECMKHILENRKYKCIYHNAIFDLHMFRHFGVNAENSFWFCTKVGFKLLSENEPKKGGYQLKNLATKYGKHFGFKKESHTFEELFGKDCKFNTVPIEYASVYAIKDTHLTLNLYKWIMSFYDRMPQFHTYWETIERPTLLVALEMEENGLNIDKEFAKEYAEELRLQLLEIEKELKEYFGDVNVDSPKQLAEFLYDVKKLDDISKKRSTSKDVLKVLAKKFKGCDILLKYRDLNKLYSTYILPLPEKVSTLDSRLHGSFMQDGTVTGRFASEKPNLQNLPYRARHIVVAPEGKIIIGIDYSWLM